ncbi:MAG: serine/threonine protein kinase [Planctomycetes bacterium]|nr:serine/threonine protein kinase [Planctomycetota bacterium]
MPWNPSHRSIPRGLSPTRSCPGFDGGLRVGVGANGALPTRRRIGRERIQPDRPPGLQEVVVSSQPDRVRQLFGEALERAATERAAFLAQVCGDDAPLRQLVEQLLADHAELDAVLPEARATGERPGDLIGPYKLLEVIGEGGFGTVWMAEQQQPIRRKVALKVVKWGMDTRQVVARFEAERQALALMEHPHIAKVFDGGATATGRPYFAMELVRGVPITQYCDEARLTPRERIELLVPVCEAVQHAHHKGVIHRDLKPSNVLVTLHDGKPVPKVIDFGIAKATAGQLTDKTVFTGFRQMLGTPEYMAPEQVEMSGLDIDTRADVYSLGVLLYELLTGTKPFELKEALEAGWQELVRRIKEVDPEKPSTRVSTLGERVTGIAGRRRMMPKGLSHAFRGDLDWIALKAMEKERGRRYETAHALAEDLLRHLRDEPVLAGPPSGVYRLRKYLRRHRVGAAALATVAVSLVAGAIVAGWGYRTAKAGEERAVEAAAVAEREKAAAEAARQNEVTHRERAEAVLDLLRRMVGSSHPAEQKAPDYEVRQLLEDFDHELGELAGLDPAVEATLREMIADVYFGLSLRATAEPHLERALALRQGGGDEAALAGCLHLLGRGLVGQRPPAELLRYLEQAREIVQRLEGPRGSTMAGILRDEADVLMLMGRLEEAESRAREAWEQVRQSQGAESRASAEIQGALVRVLAARGSLDEAEASGRQRLSILRGLSGDHGNVIALALRDLARTLIAADKLEEAESCLQEAWKLAESGMGDNHPFLAEVLDDLGKVRYRAGQYEAAVALHRDALERLHRVDGCDSQVASVTNNLGMALANAGKLEEGARLLRRAVDDARRVYGESPALASYMINLGAILERLGRIDDAEPLAREAVDIERRVPGGGPRLAEGLYGLAGILARQGRIDDAEPLAREAVDLERRAEKPTKPRIVTYLRRCAALAWSRGRVDEAESLQREAWATQEGLTGAIAPPTLDVLRQLVELLCRRKQPQDVEAVFGVEVERARASGEQRHLAAVLYAWGSIFEMRRQHADAESALTQALALAREGQDRADGRFRVDVLNALGLAMMNQPAAVKKAQAAPLLREALDLRLQLDDGPGLLSVPGLVVNLARALQLQGTADANEEAVRLLREQIRARRALVGRADPGVVSMRRYLVGILAALGRHSEIEPELREQIGALQEGGQAQPGELAWTMLELASCLGLQGRNAEALPLAEEALTVAKDSGADREEAVALASEVLGSLLASAGRHAEAEPHWRARLDWLRSQPGRERAVASAAGNLGETLLRLRRFDDAETLLREAVDLVRAHDSARPQRLASEQSRLGVVLLEQESFAEAEPILRENLEQWRAAVGDLDEHYVRALGNLATALAGLGRLDDSIGLLQDQADRLRRSGSDGEVALARCSTLLATRLLEAGRGADAESPAREALAIQERRATGSWDHHRAMALLGRVLAAAGRLDDAEPLLVEAATRMLQPDSPTVPRQTIVALARLYREQGREELAQQWEQKLRDAGAREEERTEGK